LDLRKKTVRGSVWAVGNVAFRRLINFAVFATLARLLLPEDFGLIAYAAVVLAVSETLVDQGLGVAITQREDLGPRHINAAFWMNMAAGVLLAAAVYGSADWIAVTFRAQELGLILQALSVVLVLRGAVVVQIALLRRHFRFKALAGASVAASVLGGAVGIAAAFRGMGVWSLVLQQITQAGTEAVLVSVLGRWVPKFSFDWSAAKELASFSSNVLGASLLNVISRRFDDFLIGYVLGPAALGYYTMAYRVLQLGTQFLVTSTNRVALSSFSRLQGDPTRLKQAFLTAIRLSATVAAPAFVGLSVLAPEFVLSVFGPSWQPTVPVLRLLALVGIRFSLNYYHSSVYFAVGRPDVRTKLLLLHTIANVVAFLIAVRYGIVAVAAAYVARSYLLAPIDLFVLPRFLPMKATEYLQQLVVPAVCCAVMVTVLLITQSLLSGWPGLLVGSVVGIAAYTVTLRLVGADVFREVTGILREVLRST
jgi:PST family polysaccharide transporter